MSTPSVTQGCQSRQAGLTLIELVMFIVIVSIGVTGILLVMSVTTRHSADPLIRKQALAIAESLLEEIELQPFTFCDPDDANVSTATVSALAPVPGQTGCATTVQGLGPAPANSSRFTQLNIPRFNNVGDYHGYAMNPVVDITNTGVAALAAYSASVAITNPAAAIAGVPADAILRIDVRVQGPSSTDITLTGYRFRYAPREP